jgi:hypothetical protein
MPVLRVDYPEPFYRRPWHDALPERRRGRQPKAYIGGADKLFDANGKLADDATHKFLEAFMLAYDAWVAANSKS